MKRRNMKKEYMTPQMEVIEFSRYQPLLAGSFEVDSNVGIDGGTGGDDPAMVPGLDDASIFGMPSFFFD